MGFSEEKKRRQRTTLKAFLGGKDAFAFILTGFGRRLSPRCLTTQHGALTCKFWLVHWWDSPIKFQVVGVFFLKGLPFLSVYMWNKFSGFGKCSIWPHLALVYSKLPRVRNTGNYTFAIQKFWNHWYTTLHGIWNDIKNIKRQFQ